MSMSNKGFSHIGLSTLNLDRTRAFYEEILGFKQVVADTLLIREGGRLRHAFFDVGRGQLVGFMEARDVPGVARDYDAGINRGLGVPAAFYHFAFEAGSETALADKRQQLRDRGVEVSDVVDHGWAKSIYFQDPNGLSLEYCCLLRDLNEDDAVMQERGTIPLAALHFESAAIAEVSRVQSAREQGAEQLVT
jgi:catechol 2,3-dioxygenase-like lactoylglutathione lyase family enzyme